jgi:hypothetical protein
VASLVGYRTELCHSAVFPERRHAGICVRTPPTGAVAAQIAFDARALTALSSGSWANGELLVDVDYNNLYQNVAGTVALAGGSARTILCDSGEAAPVRSLQRRPTTLPMSLQRQLRSDASGYTSGQGSPRLPALQRLAHLQVSSYVSSQLRRCAVAAFAIFLERL